MRTSTEFSNGSLGDQIHSLLDVVQAVPIRATCAVVKVKQRLQGRNPGCSGVSNINCSSGYAVSTTRSQLHALPYRIQPITKARLLKLLEAYPPPSKKCDPCSRHGYLTACRGGGEWSLFYLVQSLFLC